MKQRKQRIEQVVVWHMHHALILPFLQLDLHALRSKKG
jgi:hypothetical protein